MTADRPTNTNETNDIDALLEHLRSEAYRQQIPFGNPDPSRWTVALTALVADRDALREQLRLCNIDQFNTEALVAERKGEQP